MCIASKRKILGEPARLGHRQKYSTPFLLEKITFLFTKKNHTQGMPVLRSASAVPRYVCMKVYLCMHRDLPSSRTFGGGLIIGLSCLFLVLFAGTVAAVPEPGRAKIRTRRPCGSLNGSRQKEKMTWEQKGAARNAIEKVPL